MHDIDVRIRCPNRYCEVLPENVILAECLLEELLYRVLATFFEVVFIGDVALAFWPASIGQSSSITIGLRAQGYSLLSPLSLDVLDRAIRERLLGALVELFGSLRVERFALRS